MVRTMSKEAKYFGTAVGVSAGILAWVVGLHKTLWSAHPQSVLLAIVFVVAVGSAVIIGRGERRGCDHVENSQSQGAHV